MKKQIVIICVFCYLLALAAIAAVAVRDKSGRFLYSGHDAEYNKLSGYKTGAATDTVLR